LHDQMNKLAWPLVKSVLEMLNNVCITGILTTGYNFAGGIPQVEARHLIPQYG